MAVQHPVASPSPAQFAATSELEIPNFDERWSAWQARGKAHERAVRRKMAIALPILLVLASIVLYAVLGN